MYTINQSTLALATKVACYTSEAFPPVTTNYPFKLLNTFQQELNEFKQSQSFKNSPSHRYATVQNLADFAHLFNFYIKYVKY